MCRCSAGEPGGAVQRRGFERGRRRVHQRQVSHSGASRLHGTADVPVPGQVAQTLQVNVARKETFCFESRLRFHQRRRRQLEVPERLGQQRNRRGRSGRWRSLGRHRLLGGHRGTGGVRESVGGQHHGRREFPHKPTAAEAAQHPQIFALGEWEFQENFSQNVTCTKCVLGHNLWKFRNIQTFTCGTRSFFNCPFVELCFEI